MKLILRHTLIVLLLLCYTLFSVGYGRSTHYCGGSLIANSITLLPIHHADACGASCDMDEEEPCCSDELSYFKKQLEQDTQHFLGHDKDVIDALIQETIPAIYSQGYQVASLKIATPLMDRPPPDPLPIYKRIACFRI